MPLQSEEFDSRFHSFDVFVMKDFPFLILLDVVAFFNYFTYTYEESSVVTQLVPYENAQKWWRPLHFINFFFFFCHIKMNGVFYTVSHYHLQFVTENQALCMDLTLLCNVL